MKWLDVAIDACSNVALYTVITWGMAKLSKFLKRKGKPSAAKVFGHVSFAMCMGLLVGGGSGCCCRGRGAGRKIYGIF